MGKKQGVVHKDNSETLIDARSVSKVVNEPTLFASEIPFVSGGKFHHVYRLRKVHSYMTGENPHWLKALEELDKIIKNSNPCGKRRPQKVNFARFLAGVCAMQMAAYYKANNQAQNSESSQQQAVDYFKEISSDFWSPPQFKGIDATERDELMGFFDVVQFKALLQNQPLLRQYVVSNPVMLRYALITVATTCPKPLKENFSVYATRLLFDAEKLSDDFEVFQVELERLPAKDEENVAEESNPALSALRARTSGHAVAAFVELYETINLQSQREKERDRRVATDYFKVKLPCRMDDKGFSIKLDPVFYRQMKRVLRSFNLIYGEKPKQRVIMRQG